MCEFADKGEGTKNTKIAADVIQVSPLALHVLVGDGEADEALDDLARVEPGCQRRTALVRDAEAPDRHGLVWAGNLLRSCSSLMCQMRNLIRPSSDRVPNYRCSPHQGEYYWIVYKAFAETEADQSLMGSKPRLFVLT